MSGRKNSNGHEEGNFSCFLILTLHSVVSCFGSEYMATKQQKSSVPASYSELLLLWVINFKDKLYFELTEI